MPTSDQPANSSLSSVPLVGAAVNASLAGLKIIAGVFGNSYALIADGIESTADIVTSLIVWSGLRVAATPANERHPYGFGKAEAIAGMVAAIALLGAAVTIAVQSKREIVTPHHLPHWSTLVVLIMVIVLKEGLARWVGQMSEEAESAALLADAWHHRSDAITSTAAFIGISVGLLGGPGYEPADDWSALVACVVISYSGILLISRAIRELLDAAPASEIEQRIREIAISVPKVLAIEKCRIRKSGMVYFVEIHVQVDGNATVQDGHITGGRVRSTLKDSGLRIADAIIHIEPYAEHDNSATAEPKAENA